MEGKDYQHKNIKKSEYIYIYNNIQWYEMEHQSRSHTLIIKKK